MNTERRENRSAPKTETGRRSLRYGSRLAQCKDRANRSEQANAVSPPRVFPACASGQTASPADLPVLAAPSSQQQDDRHQQLVRPLCPGSPPLRQAAAPRPFLDRLIGFSAVPFPAFFARLHRALPHVPAACPVSPVTKTCRLGPQCGRRRRTERYDGKRNLHFQHAA